MMMMMMMISLIYSEECGTCGGQEKCVQDFDGETWGKETTWKT